MYERYSLRRMLKKADEQLLELINHFRSSVTNYSHNFVAYLRGKQKAQLGHERTHLI